jgi:hypothetical protein
VRDVELLVAIAQIAVGLAGFTGVAGVLRRRLTESESKAQAERLRGMLELALVVGGAALLPIVIRRAGAEEATAWRLAAAGLLVTIVPVLVFGIRRAARVNREVGTPARSMMLWRTFVLTMAVFVVLALASGVVGLAPAASVYPLALYALLVWSAMLFLRFFRHAGH